MKNNFKKEALCKLYCIYVVIHKLFNNGWRKIETVKDFEKVYSFETLPKGSYFDIIVDGKIEYNWYYSGNISSDRYVSNNVTHFRKSKRHKLPRF